MDGPSIWKNSMKFHQFLKRILQISEISICSVVQDVSVFARRGGRWRGFVFDHCSHDHRRLVHWRGAEPRAHGVLLRDSRRVGDGLHRRIEHFTLCGNLEMGNTVGLLIFRKVLLQICTNKFWENFFYFKIVGTFPDSPRFSEFSAC